MGFLRRLVQDVHGRTVESNRRGSSVKGHCAAVRNGDNIPLQTIPELATRFHDRLTTRGVVSVIYRLFLTESTWNFPRR